MIDPARQITGAISLAKKRIILSMGFAFAVMCQAATRAPPRGRQLGCARA